MCDPIGIKICDDKATSNTPEIKKLSHDEANAVCCGKQSKIYVEMTVLAASIANVLKPQPNATPIQWSGCCRTCP